MNDFLRLGQTDLQQMFSDWGITAQLEEVLSRYNPLSGVVEERVFRTPISLLPQSIRMAGLKTSTANDNLLQRAWFLRPSEIPAGMELTTARIIVEDTRFEIQSVQETQTPGLVLVQCLKIQCLKAGESP